MGTIFLYIHIPHILHILSTQSTQINHIRRFSCSLPVSIFLVGSYIPYRFFSLPQPLVLVSRFRLPHSFPSQSFRFSLCPRCVSFALIAFRLVVPSRRGGSCRVVLRLVVSAREACRFRSSSCRIGSLERCAVCRLVSSVSSRGAGRFVSSGGVVSSRPVGRLVGRCVLRGGSFIVPPVGSSNIPGFFPSRRSSRAIVSLRRLVFPRRVRCVVSLVLFVIAHRWMASRLRSGRWYRAGCLVKAMRSVACFLFYSNTCRFCQLRLPSWWGCGLLPIRRWSVTWASSFPCVIAAVPPCCAFRRRLVMGRSARRLVLSCRGASRYRHRLVVAFCSSSGGLSAFPITARAVFDRSRFPV